MKFTIFILCSIFFSVYTEEVKTNMIKIKVIPRAEEPGFWDGRDIAFIPKKNYRNNGRIVGGQEVEPNYHPYQAGLFHTMGTSIFLCGGSLISKRVVLTAAHWWDFTTQLIHFTGYLSSKIFYSIAGTTQTEVVLGAHYLSLNVAEPTQQRFIVTLGLYRPHPNYDSRRLFNDIALLFLPVEAVLNDYVQTIALPRNHRDQLFVGQRAVLSGWGRFNDSSWATSPTLRSVSNYVITNEECARTYGDMIIESTLCMRNFGQASCHGDSGDKIKSIWNWIQNSEIQILVGGPLTLNVYDEQNVKQQVQIGVVSFGSARGCVVEAREY